MGTHRRRSIECTLATGFFPHRRMREPAGPYGFSALANQFAGRFPSSHVEVPSTLNCEDELLLSFMFADYLLH
jgi:hypothetical protein